MSEHDAPSENNIQLDFSKRYEIPLSPLPESDEDEERATMSSSSTDREERRALLCLQHTLDTLYITNQVASKNANLPDDPTPDDIQSLMKDCIEAEQYSRSVMQLIDIVQRDAPGYLNKLAEANQKRNDLLAIYSDEKDIVPYSDYNPDFVEHLPIMGDVTHGAAASLLTFAMNYQTYERFIQIGKPEGIAKAKSRHLGAVSDTKEKLMDYAIALKEGYKPEVIPGELTKDIIRTMMISQIPQNSIAYKLGVPEVTFIDDNIPDIKLNRILLAEVFRNFANNGVKAVDKLPKGNFPNALNMMIFVETKGDTVEFTFRDNGIGLGDKDEYDFEQKSETGFNHGNAFGLKTSRRSVRKLDGDIKLLNRKDARGSDAILIAKRSFTPPQ